MRILIVEDAALTATAMRMALAVAGYRVVGIADRAARAVKLTASLHPTLALVDLHLDGDDDGIDIARVMAERQVAVLFVTAAPDRARRARGAALGCLHKPFSADDLLGAVRICGDIIHASPTPLPAPARLELYPHGRSRLSPGDGGRTTVLCGNLPDAT